LRRIASIGVVGRERDGPLAVIEGTLVIAIQHRQRSQQRVGIGVGRIQIQGNSCQFRRAGERRNRVLGPSAARRRLVGSG
jgi:hypothetical protein